ncbi:MAG: sel1 repeat family protein [Gammaproteobacteria bacterium]|nr:sel1 repeat family protein [Gammaproteobacteria bacterium]MDH5801864.1 sel1 repeat family protein [Gammaproteobacteria bacterium]
MSAPSRLYAEPHKSVFGFEFDLPSGWQVLAPSPKGVYSNETLQTLGSVNIFRTKTFGSLLKNVKAGTAEFLFRKNAAGDGFHSNVLIQLVPVDTSKPLACDSMQQTLEKAYSRKLVLKDCGSKSVEGMKYLQYAYERPVQGTTLIHHELPIGNNSKLLISGSGESSNIKELRRFQPKLAAIAAAYINSMQDLGESAEQAYQSGEHGQAFQSYVRLAKLGDAAAEYKVGLLYEQGQGVGQDTQKAIDYFQAAAARNYAAAITKVAEAYYRGTVLKKDRGKAVQLYKQAAELGDAAAQNSYASLLYLGIDVRRDQKQAKDWFEKARRQGHKQAEKNLISIYKSEARSTSLSDYGSDNTQTD